MHKYNHNLIYVVWCIFTAYKLKNVKTNFTESEEISENDTWA